MKIDINCDMGESFGVYRIGEDEKIIRYVSSANIACGFHAGDPQVIERTIALAKSNGVAVGAHPGYPDLIGFGRRNLETFPGEIRSLVLYQIGAFSAFARAAGCEIQHVKPHGALYNHAAKNEAAAAEIIDAVKSFDPDLVLYALAGSLCAEMALDAGLKVAQEAFPDRAYTRDGRLASRKLEGGLIRDPQKIRERVLRMAKTGKIISIEGEEISVRADTLCVHGDTPGAWELAKAIRDSLEEAGVEVSPIGRR